MFRVIPLAYMVFYALFEGSKSMAGSVEYLPYALNQLDPDESGSLKHRYDVADRRLIILDSRHTLREPNWEPEHREMKKTLRLLQALVSDERNTVCIASGTNMRELEKFYGRIDGLILAAEVASVVRNNEGDLVSSITGTREPLLPTKQVEEDARDIIEQHERDYGLGQIPDLKIAREENNLRLKYKNKQEITDHYKIQALVTTLQQQLEEKYEHWGLDVSFTEKSFRINFKPRSADKGLFVEHMLEKFEKEHQGSKIFGLTIGDTKPRDDRMHESMTDKYYGVIVTPPREDCSHLETSAQYRLEGVQQTQEFLKKLIK